MIKFDYDYNDKKVIKFDNEDIVFYRVVAKRDINNPYCKIKKGEKGGYVTIGSLAQEGECWVDKKSIVGKGCFVGGDAYVIDSILMHDVVVGNSAAVSDSRIKPDKRCSIFGGAVVVKSKINGDVNLSGEARLDECEVKGYLAMTDDTLLQRCIVKTNANGMKMFNEESYTNKKLSGNGPFYSDSFKVMERA